ncbi:glycosyltransferase family 2 protein [Flavobacterium sp. FZUC8N2.13]|uniref:Glycosyltransferase family 2 protein n=1 Tax=Flavobacterium zubiriense TaxID=3138075 RepID=A0ABV4T7J6_9FLAO
MKLSVALCTYNGSRFLEKQLNSILEQTIAVDEIIICDDNSSDETIKIINSYKNNYPELISLFQNSQNLGTIKNFERAISLTTGDLIFLSDQDDIWYPKKVEINCQFFEKNQNCILVFSNGDLIDDNERFINETLWDKWKFDDQTKSIWNNNTLAFNSLIKGDNKITGATVCFKKSLKNTIFPIELPLGYWHDSWLGTNAAAQQGLFFIEKSLIKYRLHIDQQVGISNVGLEKIILNANKKFIDKQKYFLKLRIMYPHLKKYIPYQMKKNGFKIVLLKVKRYFNL